MNVGCEGGLILTKKKYKGSYLAIVESKREPQIVKVYSLSVKIEMVLTLTYLNKLGNSVKVKKESKIVKLNSLSTY